MAQVPNIDANEIFKAQTGREIPKLKKPKKTYHTPPVDTTA